MDKRYTTITRDELFRPPAPLWCKPVALWLPVVVAIIVAIVYGREA